MTLLRIQDENTSGLVSHEFLLEVEGVELTLRQLIKLRIDHEVAQHNQKQPEYFNGLVQPTDAERVLNGYRLREKRQVDAEKQYYLALDAFVRNGFFVLVDNRQATELDETIRLTPTSTVSFIKLTPLVGG